MGKTHAVRKLGKSFKNFVEINFEYAPNFCALFEEDLDPKRIVRDLSLLTKEHIVPGETLLFFDEIQACPKAITALRYFYEMMSDLHVVAAGSLLEFAQELIGIPVGRVQSLYVYPMTFLEYLVADGETQLAKEIVNGGKLHELVHKKLLKHLGFYLALGGMPEVINEWISSKDIAKCMHIQSTLLDTYKQDFQKYSKKSQLKYLNLLFESIPRQLGEKFKFSKIGEYRKRELEPSLELLLTASILNKVIHTSAQGIPIGAEANLNKFKLIFIDIGLTQNLLELDLTSWITEPEKEIVNKGKIIEAFVGQEILAYSDSHKKTQLYYWQRESRSSSAEVDYVIQKENAIIPVEVKSGKTMKLKSLHFFLDSHKQSKFGYKISIDQNYESNSVHSLPLYSLACLGEEVELIKSLFEF